MNCTVVLDPLLTTHSIFFFSTFNIGILLPTSGPLHMLFPPVGTFYFSHRLANFWLILKAEIKCHFLGFPDEIELLPYSFKLLFNFFISLVITGTYAFIFMINCLISIPPTRPEAPRHKAHIWAGHQCRPALSHIFDWSRSPYWLRPPQQITKHWVV